MPCRGRSRALVLAALVAVATVPAAPSYASGPRARPALDAGTSMTFHGWLVPVVALALAGGSAIWRATTAQKIAKQSGLDPGLATQVSLMSENGLDAEYLAANLRQPGSPAPAGETPDVPSSSGKDAAGRLEELQGLLAGGLITQSEYDDRRRAIIDSV